MAVTTGIRDFSADSNNDLCEIQIAHLTENTEESLNCMMIYKYLEN